MPQFNEYLKKVAQNIKEARKAKKLTQEDMQDFGFNYRYYQAIEGGKVNVTLRTLWLISTALNIPIERITKT